MKHVKIEIAGVSTDGMSGGWGYGTRVMHVRMWGPSMARWRWRS
jgi:hypothetical protein